MKTVRFVLALLALSLIAPLQSAKAADVICYNCPPEWADWASMLKAIKADLKYDIPHDNKNSGQALAQILDENPFRNAWPVREQGCPRWHAGAGMLEGPAEAGLQGYGRLSRSIVSRRRICRSGRDQSGAWWHRSQFRPGYCL